MQYRKLAAVLVILCVAACTSVKDEPLPLSRENIEKYAAAVGKSSRKLEPNTGSVIERVDVLYRTPLENLLGYSFDRTLRHYFVHRAGITADPESRVFADLITPGAQAVLMNADEALRAGMISMRTRDLLSVLSKFRCDHALLLSSGEWERMAGFLTLVADCSKLGGGACSTGTLMEMALQQGVIPQEEPLDGSSAGSREPALHVRDALYGKFNLARWDGTGLFIGPDAEEIDASRLLDDPDRQFTVNERVVYFADQYSKMVREEQGLAPGGCRGLQQGRSGAAGNRS
ncbi:MAG TPA: hypothetical protein VLA94_06440 [Syntrophales bacterium]|nr:hypothetical protein [Syntrophales bacterium]